MSTTSQKCPRLDIDSEFARSLVGKKKLKLSTQRTSNMQFVRRCLRPQPYVSLQKKPRTYHRSSIISHDTDSCGVPVRPTWSVNTFLSSYPTPTISSATLSHLHELSALIPPPAGTQEHVILKREMEDLIRLVEAVKSVDTRNVHLNGLRDKRNVDQQYGNQQLLESTDQHDSGRKLLNHASRTLDGFYVVDADRRR